MIEQEPWEKTPWETPRAYDAFTKYRDMGPKRTVRGCGLQLGLKHQCREWSAQHDWVNRAAAFDAAQDRALRTELAEQRTAMLKRHAQVGALLTQKAIERLRDLDVAKLSIRDAIALIETGSRLERQSRGEPDLRGELAVTGSLDQGPSGVDILNALRMSPELLDLADQLDTVLAAGGGRSAASQN